MMGLYPVFAAGDGKTLRAIDAVAIEQSDRGQSQLGCTLGQLLGERGAAEKAESAGSV